MFGYIKTFFSNIWGWINYYWQKFGVSTPKERLKSVFLIIGIIVVLAGAAVAVIMFLKRQKEEETETQYAPAEESQEQITTESEPEIKQGVFTVQEEDETSESPSPDIDKSDTKILEPEPAASEPEQETPVKTEKTEPEQVIKKTIQDEQDIKEIEQRSFIKTQFIKQIKYEMETEFINIIKRYFPEKFNFREKIVMSKDDINRCNYLLEKLEDLNRDKDIKFSKDYYHKKSIFYLASEQDSKFEKSIKKEIELYPDNDMAHVIGASYYLDNDSFDLAEQYLNKAQEINQSNFDVYFLLGELYFKKNEYEKSLDMFKKVILLEPKNPLAHAFKGYILAKTGYVSDGEQALKKAIKLDLTNPFPYYFLGNIYKNLRFYKKAINNYQKALGYGCLFSELIENYAFCLLRIKKYNELIKELCPFEKQNRLSAHAKQHLADAYTYTGNYKKAISLLVEAYEYLRKKEDVSDLEIKIGNVYFYNIKDYQEAEKYYLRAREKDENNYQVNQNLEHINYQKSRIKLHNNLGVIYAQSGNYEEAIKEFEKALEIDKNNPEAIHNFEKAAKLLSEKNNSSYQEKKVV